MEITVFFILKYIGVNSSNSQIKNRIVRSKRAASQPHLHLPRAVHT